MVAPNKRCNGKISHGDNKKISRRFGNIVGRFFAVLRGAFAVLRVVFAVLRDFLPYCGLSFSDRKKITWYDLGGHVSSRDTCGKCDVGTRRLLHGPPNCTNLFFAYYLVFAQVPLRVVALEVVGSERGGAVARRVEAVARVGCVLSGNGVRHDAVGAVGELFDAPELSLFASRLAGGEF